jgi:hypothetical protein
VELDPALCGLRLEIGGGVTNLQSHFRLVSSLLSNTPKAYPD